MEAEPKSPSLTCPGSVSKMFPAFTSLRRERAGTERRDGEEGRRDGGKAAHGGQRK